jgi:hypothetical protein
MTAPKKHNMTKLINIFQRGSIQMKFSTTGQEKDDLLKQVTDSLRGDHLGRFDFSYSISTLVSSTNKTDSHDITEIL